MWHPAPEAEIPSEDAELEGVRLAVAYTGSLRTYVIGDGGLKVGGGAGEWGERGGAGQVAGPP